MLGIGVVLTTGLPVRVGVLVVVIAINVASELVSFSALIERVAPSASSMASAAAASEPSRRRGDPTSTAPVAAKPHRFRV
ncbi:MAG: hypothetical protein WKF43_16065 [Acidimicrobiales bacterium]